MLIIFQPLESFSIFIECFMVSDSEIGLLLLALSSICVMPEMATASTPIVQKYVLATDEISCYHVSFVVKIVFLKNIYVFS